MKKTILILLLLAPVFLFGQDQEVLPAHLMRAKLLLRTQPTEAFNLYTKYAQQGNPEAMNALGLIYSKGVGTAKDEHAAINWFEKAAKGGYSNALYNWGMMYQHGFGVTINYSEAVKLYKEGTLKSNGLCFYALGYMYYKGFGCKQNYESAFALFVKGCQAKNLQSMYMKGLCFRNGYGVKTNTDSAKYWLSVAAKAGSHEAAQELNLPKAESKPEATTVINFPYLRSFPALGDLKVYKKIKHALPKENINGEYSGVVVRFDWSGKRIIDQSPLTLKLTAENNTLKGTWNEDGVSIPLSANLSDTGITFNSSNYQKNDHYNSGNPNDLLFKSAHLQIAKNSDTTLLYGNLQLFSLNHNEPEKPIFVLLAKIDDGTPKQVKDTTTINKLAFTNKSDSLKFRAFPNPTQGNLKLNYTLSKTCNVSITITDLLYSKPVYIGKSEVQSPGEHTADLNLTAPPGTYVVTLKYGDKLRSAVIFKQ